MPVEEPPLPNLLCISAGRWQDCGCKLVVQLPEQLPVQFQQCVVRLRAYLWRLAGHRLFFTFPRAWVNSVWDVRAGPPCQAGLV